MGSFLQRSTLRVLILFYAVLNFYSEMALASASSSGGAVIAELEESIMDLQLKSSANKVNIGGSLENSFNFFR